MAITVADKKLWERAIEKCKAEKPRVRTLEFGKFEVAGSKNDLYIVTWSGKGQEMKAECSCKAGQKNAPCYHVPATSGAFKLQVHERATARLHSLDCPRCGETFQSENSGQFFCTPCENKHRAEQILKDSTDLFGEVA